MKCPWCNTELKEGALYCDVCGEEIYMVPNFDPEVEDTCRETIESMTKDIFGSKADPELKNNSIENNVKDIAGKIEETDFTVGSESEFHKQTIKQRDNKKEQKRSKSFSILRFTLFSVLAALIIALTICIAFYVSTDEYKLKQAQKAYSSGEFDKSVTLYNELLEKDRFNVDLMIACSESLAAGGRLDEYEAMLHRIADDSYATEKQRIDAYGKILELYSQNNRYEEAKQFVLASKDAIIIDIYSEYLVEEPYFELEQKIYDFEQLLAIADNNNNKIIYSLTVKRDNELLELDKDIEYTEPLLLEDGKYTVSAYSVNEHGVKSNAVTAEYEIKLIPPQEPVVVLEEGTYYAPQYLEIIPSDEKVNVYFTSDGSNPGLSSQIYKEPILLPSGNSSYKFVAIDDRGLCSEIVSCNYALQYYYEIGPAVAVDTIISYLLEKGTIISYEGVMENGGRLGLEFKYFMLIDDDYYYVFEEYLDDGEQNTYLDVKYAVNMLSGEFMRLEQA